MEQIFCFLLIFSDSVSDTGQSSQSPSVTMVSHIPPLHSHLQPRSLKHKILHIVGEKKWNRWRVHTNVEEEKSSENKPQNYSSRRVTYLNPVKIKFTNA